MPAPDAPAPRSRLPLLLAKLVITGLALHWAVSRTSFGAMIGAVSRVPPLALALAVGIGLVNLAVGALRFRDVLAGYGVREIPPFGFLFHGYLVASFYNTFVPGNVGGDALRAHTAKRAFGSAADAYVAVILERGLGVSALLCVSGAAAFASRGVPSAWVPPALLAGGLVLTGVTLAGPALLHRLLGVAPERFRAFLGDVSVPAMSVPFARAFAWSVATQTLSVLAAHVLLVSLAPQVTLADSLALVPLAMLSIYVPVSLMGLGLREAAFVVLFARLGVAPDVATAASLAFMASLMVVAALGGLGHAIRPLVLPGDPASPGGA